MSGEALDRAWLARHPLPVHGDGTDKNSRGRVLAVGGSMLVPGAIRLTAEAAFRAGAGKVRMATIAETCVALGVAMPEAGFVALPSEDGEIALAALPTLLREIDGIDAAVLGPGIGDRDVAAHLTHAMVAAPRDGLSLVLDAACITGIGANPAALCEHGGRVVLTPHHGEMAACLECDEDTIAADPVGTARRTAATFGSVIVLKSSTTIIAAPGGAMLCYDGGGVGLATGGSGDILAGVIGGLLSRGAAPLVAAAWGVWLHGEAGRRLADAGSPIGFLARELLPEIPRLMASP